MSTFKDEIMKELGVDVSDEMIQEITNNKEEDEDDE